MKVSVTSLTGHRIDIRFAQYISMALLSPTVSIEEADILVVTNGMYNKAYPEVLRRMKEIPSIYLIDDHTCWIPDLTTYPACKIYSQFVEHPLDKTTPMSYFQVSKLALFDPLFDKLEPSASKNREYKYIYWGNFKPERSVEYRKYLNSETFLIGKRYPDDIASMCIMQEPTKFLDTLNILIRKGVETYIFGDKYHNGVNLPYRIYEALMNGVIPNITVELLGSQIIDISWCVDYLRRKITTDNYKSYLCGRRSKVTKEIHTIILTHYNKGYQCDKDSIDSATFENTADEIESVLRERKAIYGSYDEGVKCRASMMKALNDKHIECNGDGLPEDIRVMFSDILLKLMRAASDPTHTDSWLDLAGYSKLINERISNGSE